MFNPDDENDRQAAIRRDRDFSTMDAPDRLAWANAASTPAEIAAKEAAKAAAETAYTRAQLDYLGDRNPEDLTSQSDLDNFEALGGEIFRERTSKADEQPTTTGGPLTLDSEKLGASDLSPERKTATLDAFERLKRAEREAHLNPAVRRDRPSEIAAARLLVKPFLKK
ncbi:MAG: hypothetical protein KDK08_26060 [Rhizobiaceae bacterium]|nr:hypothetical protein [Rhizobiaceae bacterium]